MTALILSSITWMQFALISGIGSIIWIAWTYRENILGKGPPPPAGTKRVWSVADQKMQHPTDEQVSNDYRDNVAMSADLEEENEEEEESEFSLMEKMLQYIEDIVTEQKYEPEKETLIAALHPLFLEYTTLQVVPFRTAIHNFLSKIALKELGISLTDQELDQLWIAKQ
ncbi:hypothetical protein ACQKLP_10960 [Chitinophaga sp. NPDC101104]|uniref:hypothetical protein n=1 Tax=Chitinophaga sp. NPDC101104 TaxID=3390561 RepID=UPI003D009871